MPGIRFPSSEIEKDNLRDSRGEQIRIENKETFASSEIEKDNLRESQGKQIRTENKESFESKVLKRKQHIVLQLPLPSWFRRLPIASVGRTIVDYNTSYMQ